MRRISCGPFFLVSQTLSSKRSVLCKRFKGKGEGAEQTAGQYSRL